MLERATSSTQPRPPFRRRFRRNVHACMEIVTFVGRWIVLLLAVNGLFACVEEHRREGRTSLLVRAAYHNNVEHIQSLLDMGVDLNRLDVKGNTALDVALFRGAAEAARLLRNAGAEEGLSRWRYDMRVYEEPIE